MKSECTNEPIEREFTGECRTCGTAGHRASDCPNKICAACKGEGHSAENCEVNRMHAMFADMKIEEVSSDEAWNNVVAADKEKDVDDIRRAVFAYAKAFPELTLVDLEATFREADFNTYLIAKEQEVSDTHTIVNFQGKPDQKYVLSFQFSARPRRVKFSEGWPTTPEENIERLAEAGVVMDGFVQKCRNCEQIVESLSTKKTSTMVLTSDRVISPAAARRRSARWFLPSRAPTAMVRSPPQWKATKGTIADSNVSLESGHRARDCQAERKTAKSGCRNCGSDQHQAKECTAPRSAEGVECKICQTLGMSSSSGIFLSLYTDFITCHFSKECPSQQCFNCWELGHNKSDCQSERKMKCRNCDEVGHQSRECSKPTDWSRVVCTQCGENGHSYKRCKQPAKVDEADAEADGAGASGGDAGWEDAAPASGGGGGGWEDAAPAADSAGGGCPSYYPGPVDPSGFVTVNVTVNAGNVPSNGPAPTEARNQNAAASGGMTFVLDPSIFLRSANANGGMPLTRTSQLEASGRHRENTSAAFSAGPRSAAPLGRNPSSHLTAAEASSEIDDHPGGMAATIPQVTRRGQAMLSAGGPSSSQPQPEALWCASSATGLTLQLLTD
ncbi:unnamed protein product [Zymoseptoria tritici ST99CH_3D1]|nr:unnamed protein product [Zymoseptoria tritici ST99CH_3D1]